MSVNNQLSNVFEQMQRIVEDRANGIRATDGVVIFDDHLNPLSIGYLCPIELEGRKFTSAEHAMHFVKALAFEDHSAIRAITAAGSAKSAHSIKITKFNPHLWRKLEYRAMQAVCGAKIKQNASVRHALKMTGFKKLVYATHHDLYFGCGLKLTNDNILYPQFWTGQNLLGSILESHRKAI